MKMQTGSEAQTSHDGGLQQKGVNKRKTGGKNGTIAAGSPTTEVKEGRRGAKSNVNKNDEIKVDKHRENSDDQQDVLTCEICTVEFTEDGDRLMSYDRCMKWNCAESGQNNIIEEECSKYMEGVTSRIVCKKLMILIT